MSLKKKHTKRVEGNEGMPGGGPGTRSRKEGEERTRRNSTIVWLCRYGNTEGKVKESE